MHGLLTMVDGFQVSVLQTCEVRFRGPLGGFEIHGDRGSVKANSEGCQVFGEEVEGDVLHLDYPDFELSSFALEMKAFAEYVIDDVEGPTSGVCERRSLAVVQAGYESTESGAPVHLETRFGVL
jgi:predicted dehydrogenase